MTSYFKNLCFLFFLLGFITAQSQEHTAQQCGHDLLLHQNEAKYPGYIEAVNQSFDHVKSKISFNKSESEYEVRTVIHVVHANDEQNISDERIRAVMDVVNDDFSGLNSIDRGLRSLFHPLVGNSGIKFTIEEIIRHRTETTFTVDIFTGSLPDNVKQTAMGGSDARDTEQFVNIWICSIDFDLGTLLGYAYPPLCAPNWPDGSSAPSPELDGVVMDYRAVDTMGVIQEFGQTFQVRGHSLTHELGHYLGLRHIWGDGNGVIFGNPDCTVDDGIEDTPNQGLPSQGACDTLANTCTDDIDDLPDMIENFMDYSDERCLNVFTLEQVAVMHSTLENCRSNILITNQGEVENLSSNVQVLPNPSNGRVSITGLSEGVHQVSIISSWGAEVDQFNIAGHSESFDLGHLDNGLYFVVTKDENKQVLSTQKLMLLK